MSGESKPVGTMRTVTVKVRIGRQIGFHALFEAGKRKPLSRGIKTIGARGQMTIGNIWPAISVVGSFKESFPNQLFIAGVVID